MAIIIEGNAAHRAKHFNLDKSERYTAVPLLSLARSMFGDPTLIGRPNVRAHMIYSLLLRDHPNMQSINVVSPNIDRLGEAGTLRAPRSVHGSRSQRLALAQGSRSRRAALAQGSRSRRAALAQGRTRAELALAQSSRSC